MLRIRVNTVGLIYELEQEQRHFFNTTVHQLSSHSYMARGLWNGLAMKLTIHANSRQDSKLNTLSIAAISMGQHNEQMSVILISAKNFHIVTSSFG